MASLEIPGRGTCISQPVFMQWRWYYYLRNLPIWLLIALLLTAPKENRNRQAWLILIPLGLLSGIWHLPALSLFMSDETSEMVGFVVASGALAWSVVWLTGHWLGERTRIGKFWIMLVVMIAVGLFSYLCHFEDAEDFAPLLIIHCACVAVLLLAMTITGYSCRARFAPRRFCVLLVLWIWALAIGLAVSIGILIIIFTVPSNDRVEIIVIPVLAAAVLGGILYILNLPFLLLAFNSPFYRKRLENIFLINEEERDRFPCDVPLSTEPTKKPVKIADLAGRWQCYLDSSLRTVSMDFRPDGSFAQTISPNQGGIQPCPGGTWRLEGPKVFLEGYVAATDGSSQSCTWWMIDKPSGGFALFGGDGPDAQSFFRIHRQRQAID